MCEFCKNNSWFNDNILEKKINFGPFGNNYRLYTFINDGKMELGISNPNDCEDSIEFEVPINFCPLCGRVLNENHNISVDNCKYHDEYDEQEYILEESIDFGILGKNISLSVEIDTAEKKIYICCINYDIPCDNPYDISRDSEYDFPVQTDFLLLFYGTIDINFCPMCGLKL